MKKVLDKIKIFFYKEKQNIEKPVLFNPYRTWIILFCFIFVLLILFFGLNTYFFFAVKNGYLLSNNDDVGIISRNYNHDTLDKILESFLNRSKNFDEVMLNKANVTDPSK